MCNTRRCLRRLPPRDQRRARLWPSWKLSLFTIVIYSPVLLSLTVFLNGSLSSWLSKRYVYVRFFPLFFFLLAVIYPNVRKNRILMKKNSVSFKLIRIFFHSFGLLGGKISYEGTCAAVCKWHGGYIDDWRTLPANRHVYFKSDSPKR